MVRVEAESMDRFLYCEEDREEKWVNDYSSFHQILLVGDGDFSFSLCLALSFGSATNIVTTSFDSYDTVIMKYKSARSNLEMLNQLGAYILYGVDATKMKLHTDLRMRKFDRIIYNFPHAGFYGKEDNARVIRMHQNLVHGFFKNASAMLRPNGEIHVSHKTTPPFCYWKIGKLAWQNSLFLLECTDFKKEDYPGYNNKRGAGARSDDPFPLVPCSTFKFIISPRAKKTRNFSSSSPNYGNHQQPQVIQRRPDPVAFERPFFNPQQLQVIERRPDPVALEHPFFNPQELQVIERRPVPVVFTWPEVNPDMHMNYVPRPVPSYPPAVGWVQCRSNFNEYLNYVTETFRETSYSVKYLVDALRLGFERY